MKKVIFLLLFAVMLFTSCSSINNTTISTPPVSQDVAYMNSELPDYFTLTNIEDALNEYINYRLWFYPAKIMGKVEDENFDSYIGNEIDVEVRNYNGEIFASTNAGEWLAYFKVKNGIVYCEGLVRQNEPTWPKGEYTVLGNFQVKVEGPHKPNYGHSPNKDKMLVAALSYLEKYCEDMINGAERDKWIGAQGYLVDFYEYENGTSAWFIRNDGEAVNVPMLFIEENKTIKVEGLKGYSLKNVDTLNSTDPGRYLFEKQIQDAVKEVSCEGK